MNNNAMLLGAVLGTTYGNHPGSWRMPWADPNAYTDIEAHVRAAQIAERSDPFGLSDDKRPQARR